MRADAAIILMAKQPRAGKTKTRLCPPFSPTEAAQFYEAALKDTLALAGGLQGMQLAVAYSPAEALAYFQQITPAGTLLLLAEGPNIGVCLQQAFAALFGLGYTRALALNTDGPSLPLAYLAQAIHLLDDADVVLGPGEDGGYYLLGMKNLHAALFEDILWSSAHVLSQTLAQCQLLNLRSALTPPWYDVDSPQDARRLRAELDGLPASRLTHTRQFFTRFSLPDQPV